MKTITNKYKLGQEVYTVDNPNPAIIIKIAAHGTGTPVYSLISAGANKEALYFETDLHKDKKSCAAAQKKALEENVKTLQEQIAKLDKESASA